MTVIVQRVCADEELLLGGARITRTPHGPVAVFRTHTGIYALTDRCSHAEAALSDGFVEVADDTVECPSHFATFCLRTGASLSPPATEGVRTWEAAVQGGDIVLRYPERTTPG